MESQKYCAEFLGHTIVSNFFSKALVPWLVKEVQQQCHSEQVTVQLSGGQLVVTNPLAESVVAKHAVQQLHHFSQTRSDPCCFLYFIRNAYSTDNSMYLYRLRDKDMVVELFTALREHTRRQQQQYQQQRSLSDASGINLAQLRRAVETPVAPVRALSSSGCSSALWAGSMETLHQSSSHFEVLYVCKIRTSHRKGPATFIDDALRQYRRVRSASDSIDGHPSHGGVDDSRSIAGGRDRARTAAVVDSEHIVSGNASMTSSFDLGDVTPSEQAEVGEEATNENLCRASDDVTSSRTVSFVNCAGSSGAVAIPRARNVAGLTESGAGRPLHQQLSPLPESVSESELASVAAASAQLGGDTGAAALAAPGLHRSVSAEMAPLVANELSASQRVSSDSSSELLSGSSNAAASLTTAPSSGHGGNHTLLLQVCEWRLLLISPDNKTLRLHCQLCDVTQVAQGQKFNDHFGFICREMAPLSKISSYESQSSLASDNGAAPSGGIKTNSNYIGYIFRCQSRKIADEIVGVMRQSVRLAVSSQRVARGERSFCEATPCSHCPANFFNKLCAEVEGLSAEATQAVIWRAIECLPGSDQRQLRAKLSGAQFRSDQPARTNQLLMALLRLLCDDKQRRHQHVTASRPPPPPGTEPDDNLVFDLSSSLSRARRSLASRLEQVWRHRVSGGEVRTSRNCSVVTSPHQTPSKSDFLLAQSTSDSPLDGQRARSSTFSGISWRDGDDVSGQCEAARASDDSACSYLCADKCLSPADTPMFNIFRRVGVTSGSGVGNKTAGAPGFPSRSGDGSGDASSPMDVRSWRQAILQRVKTPGGDNSLHASPVYSDGTAVSVSSAAYDGAKDIWRRLINQQILLNRMERENARVAAAAVVGSTASDGVARSAHGGSPASQRTMYAELPECSEATAASWSRQLQLLSDGSSSHRLHDDQLQQLVFHGVPIRHRAEVWQLLVSHYEQHNELSCTDRHANYHAPYQQLIKELTSFQREILTDLGRTFPHHPYFRSPFGSGQLEMFNVLKAVSLLDPELGYCQGLGFIAGILLLHMPEKEAYHVLKHMLFRLDLRKQYMPDMCSMHIQMYQLSRLIHDHLRELYEHLEKYDVSPMLYATPWFMTLFASQFPIGFPARVVDFVLLCGTEALFRVSLGLLSVHQHELLARHGMEEIMEFIKTDLCRLGMQTAREVFAKAVQLDVGKQLLTYEVEYHVLQEEVLSSPSADSDLNRLGAANQNLKRQMVDLLQQLQASKDHVKILVSQNQLLERRFCDEQRRSTQLLALSRQLLQHVSAADQLPEQLQQLVATHLASTSDGQQQH